MKLRVIGEGYCMCAPREDMLDGQLSVWEGVYEVVGGFCQGECEIVSGTPDFLNPG